MSIEKYLVENCASTLASLKIGSMFNIEYETQHELAEHMKDWNQMLNSKGVFVTVLKTSRSKALIYVYRESGLKKELEQQAVGDFLGRFGYEDLDIESVLNVLRLHFSKTKFPHEVGVFLGYPLADVVGFIENEGKNFKCAGCWKVYCNEQEAVKMFCKIKKCKTVYSQLWRGGRSICQLTVAR